MRKQKLWVFVALSMAAGGGGCTAIIGLDDVHFTGGTGGGTSSGGVGGSGATGGASTGGSSVGGGTSQGGGGTGGATGGGGTGGMTTTTTMCIPTSDNNPCTKDGCDANGKPTHTPEMAGAPCVAPGGAKVCDGNGSCVACVQNSDCASMVCNVDTHLCGSIACGNGKKTGNEDCDDGNIASGDGCSALCQVEPGFKCLGDSPSVCTPVCGDGMLKGNEGCDDGGVANGDGCSSACQIEPFFDCSGAPSKCSKHEVLCGDGIDNDGDNMIDAADADCALPAWSQPCADPMKLHVYKALGAFPLAIPDNSAAGVTSVIHVADALTIADVEVSWNATHSRDKELAFTLARPTGTTRDLCINEGGFGANFTGIVLDSGCDTPLLAGVAPFSGCYKPEQPFGDMVGKPGLGAWTMKVVDDSDPHAGTLDGWTLILCGQ